jgi:hypothetical protein
MDWNHLLSWGSPVGLGAFFFGLGGLLRGLMKGKHCCRGVWDKKDK